MERRRINYRSAAAGGWNYFIVNRRQTNFDGWIVPARAAIFFIILNPSTGKAGEASVQPRDGHTEVHLQLAAGQSVILRAFARGPPPAPPWSYWQAKGSPIAVSGQWKVKFLEGGPTLSADYETSTLGSWTQRADSAAQCFAGAARYEIMFDNPLSGQGSALLDLGDVRQSARVRLNGQDYGTLIAPPFQVAVNNLEATGTKLEVEVASVSANRIRDLDQRGVEWKIFKDINIVNVDYRPFDASDWPLTECGLLGPVTLTELKKN